MGKKPSVMVAGYYGAGNAGDELLLKLLLDAMPPDIRVVVLSVNPQHTKSLHRVESVSIFNLHEVFDLMLECNVFVLGGGGLLQTHDRFTQAGLLRFDENEISAYIRPALLAKQLGLPSVAWAQGVGPLDTSDSRMIASAIFNGTDLISIRDIDSSKLLKSLGVSCDMVVAPDPIWAMPMKARQHVQHELNRSKKNIVITLRPWESHNEEWKKSLSLALDASIDPSCYRITWLPFVIASDDIDSDTFIEERRIIEDIQSLLSCEFDQEIVFAQSFDQLIDRVASADYAICMRLHAQILCHKLSIPVVSIQYDAKLVFASDAVAHHARLRVSLTSAPDDWKAALQSLLLLGGPEIIDINRRNTTVAEAKLHLKILDQGLKIAVDHAESDVAPIERINFDWLNVWTMNEPESHVHMLNSSLHNAQSKIHLLKTEREVVAQRNRVMQDELQTSLKEYLAKAAELGIQLTKEKQRASTEIQALKSTASWRMTRPLRFVRQFARSPSRAFYLTAKTVYWWLPPGLRAKTPRVRDTLLRWFHKSAYQHQAPEHTDDVDWEFFSKNLLANRAQYKGVFIQECVIDWNVPLFQRPQHLATALGRLNYLVIYRSHNWSHDNVQGFRLVAKNVWLSNSEEVDKIDNALRSIYSTAVVDKRRISQFPATSKLVYEYIDHIDPEISGDEENITRLKNQKNDMMAGGAHFVVASARKLKAEMCEEFDPSKVFLIQNGVDVTHYRSCLSNHASLPSEYTTFCSKFKVCLGYFGAMAPWLDYPLINALIKSRSDVGFVFIGPDYYGGTAQVSTEPNVLLTGAVNYAELPAYAEKFDICWIPFKSGEIAKSTSPLKLFEYFALEKPVIVTSDMQECTVYAEVLHANTAQGISAQIDVALSQRMQSPQFKAKLRQLADENDWDHRATAYAQLFKLMSRV